MFRQTKIELFSVAKNH